ncbi:CLIP-associating protein 2 isoform X23 [Lates japonicus]|uniref:CLIP-associating protein 2 isoform X23 n=1 Tax=Lates japonicus TaxID=270547 RepID=A0AAD3NHC1_LATJO|nr:CLIP-associating protein 2 isoform X23 [Lates japonicus]
MLGPCEARVSLQPTGVLEEPLPAEADASATRLGITSSIRDPSSPTEEPSVSLPDQHPPSSSSSQSHQSLKGLGQGWGASCPCSALPKSDGCKCSSRVNTAADRLGAGHCPGLTSLDDASDKTDGTRSDNGRVRTKQVLSTASSVSSQVDSRGRSRTKMVSQSQRSDESDCTPGSQSATPVGAGSRSGSPGRVLTSTALSTMSSGAHRVLAGASGDGHRRSRIPRSQGCSRDSSPTRLSVAPSSISSIYNGASRREQRGATLAPPELSTHLTLLGLQVKAEYNYFSVPHPPTPP